VFLSANLEMVEASGLEMDEAVEISKTDMSECR
jgi:hypothetical protein